MALTAIAISPNQVLLTSDGVTSALLTYNVVTGVVSSSVLPSAMTTWLTVRLQQILAADPTLATASFTPQLVRSLFVLNTASVSTTVTETNAVVSGSTWSITLAMSAGGKAYMGVPHSIEQAFANNAAAAATPVIATFAATELENATRYMSIGGLPWPYANGTIATGPQLWPCPVAGTVNQFQLQFVMTIVESAAVILTFTVQKTLAGLTTNPTDTAMVIAVNLSTVTGTRHYAVTTSGSFTVAVGDTLSVKIAHSGAVPGQVVEGIVAVLKLAPL